MTATASRLIDVSSTDLDEYTKLVVQEIVKRLHRFTGTSESALRYVGAAVSLAVGDGAVWVESLCPMVFVALREDGSLVVASEKTASAFLANVKPDAEAIKKWAATPTPSMVVIPRGLDRAVSQALGFKESDLSTRAMWKKLPLFTYPEIKAKRGLS